MKTSTSTCEEWKNINFCKVICNIVVSLIQCFNIIYIHIQIVKLWERKGQWSLSCQRSMFISSIVLCLLTNLTYKVPTFMNIKLKQLQPITVTLRSHLCLRRDSSHPGFVVSIKYNSYSVYLLIADSCPHVAPSHDPHPRSPMQWIWVPGTLQKAILHCWCR